MAKSAPAVAAPASAVSATPAVKRLPLGEARAHNKAFTFVDSKTAPKAAAIALTAKGTNPKKTRVYGYDNLADGGGVPKDKRVLLVAGTTGTPKGVAPAQWEALVKAVKANAATTAGTAKDAGVTARTIRRAYRAGYIRFSI